MYSFTPKKTNNIATVLVATLFLAAAVVFLFPAIFRNMPYTGFLQAAGLVLIIAALAVMSRYHFKYFTYVVRENGEGQPDLDVVEAQGKRRYTVCRVALGNIESVQLMNDGNREELRKKCKGRKKFAYVCDIAPTEQVYVFVTECGDPLVLILAYDETLVNLITPKTN